MKKTGCIILALILGLTVLLGGPAFAESRIGSDAELLAALAGMRESKAVQFRLSLTKEYFKRLSEDSFTAFSMIILQAGIAGYRLEYSAAGDLLLDGVSWTEPHVALCTTEEEAEEAVRDFLAEKVSSCQIIVSDPEAFEKLCSEKRIFTYAAMYGAEELSVSNTTRAPYVIYLDDIRYYSLPWCTAAGEEEWIRGIETMAAGNHTRFYLIAAPAFAEKLRTDDALLKRLEATSPMAEWRSYYSEGLNRYEFTDVVFTSEPRIVCDTAEAITETIRQMGVSGISAFNLILSGKLYETVSANNFEKLMALEAEAGMSDCELRYDSNLHILYFSGASIHSDAVKLASAEDACAFLEAAVMKGESSIALFCTPELYAYLIGGTSADNGSSENVPPLFDAITHAGISNYHYSYSQASHLIKIGINELYPGTKILCAVNLADLSLLTGREKETLSAARQIAALCERGNPLATAQAIHDALCERIVYTVDETTEEDDNAVGALLNGQANCDGYADAFYLVGTLAGLDVRYQHGDSYEKDPDEQYKDVTHLWNLLKINGTWRLVDVTWDDRENRTEYTWFNIGADRARKMHIWNEEMTVPLLAETDLSERPGNEYYVRDSSEIYSALSDAAAKEYSSFTLVLSEANGMNREEIVELLKKGLHRAFSYGWNQYMRTVNVSFDSQ